MGECNERAIVAQAGLQFSMLRPPLPKSGIEGGASSQGKRATELTAPRNFQRRRGLRGGSGRAARRARHSPGPTRHSAGRPASVALGACCSSIAVMSTAMNFGTKSFQPRPPDKGSFPLDHFGNSWLRSHWKSWALET
ncbi:uncharacterized protein LOC122113767 isoform X2 [Dipodomys spectabilis]|uniref:uncharacterized protein LOC122113767 isoform X2 n=1 Tax=Dipodomys spectabilis TaxID=105255 RepID=UPI001C5458D5|nr:uncharacterized protein LOC122113767 isoform X2 [Dipodomys spectabilis]